MRPRLSEFYFLCFRTQDPSPSRTRLANIQSSEAFNQLGRFSRALGKVIESSSKDDHMHIILEHLRELQADVERLESQWSSCKWSDVSEQDQLHPSMQMGSDAAAAGPWSIMKTLLFTLTMIYSSLIALLNSLPLLSPNSPPRPVVLDLAACAVQTFSHLYFITIQFGTEGFAAYRSLWYGSLDLLSRASPEDLERAIQPIKPLKEFSKEALDRSVSRARIAYFLNAVEQLAAKLPDAVLREQVLPVARG